MRRLAICGIVTLLLGLSVGPAAASPAHAAAEPQTTTVAAVGETTVRFDKPVAHVAVYWPDNPYARVTLAFSSDGTTFVGPVDAGRDDAGAETRDGMTYGAVHAVEGAVAVRVAADVPMERLTVVAIPSDGGAVPRLLLTAAFSPQEEGRPVVISRAGWGANAAYMTWAPRFYPPTKVIVHHTADNIVADGSQEYYAKLVRAIYYYHAVTQDWGDIAYNFLIDPLGNVYEGRYSDDDERSPAGEDIYGNGVVGGHTYSYNTATVGIAVLGTYGSKPISVAARASLERLLSWVVTRHGIDPMGSDPYFNPYGSASVKTFNIAGHLDYRPTDCPGAAFHKALPSIRQAVFDLTGPVPALVPSPTFVIIEKSDSSPVVGRKVTITATLKEASSRKPLAGRTVSFAIRGMGGETMPAGTATTDSAGVASLPLTCTSAQLQWVSAAFDPGGDSLFRGATTSTELDVALADLAAVSKGAQVQLSWRPEAAATSYNVYRNGKKVNTAPVFSAGYLDSGFSNGTGYSYQVTAIVGGRESAKPPAVVARTGAVVNPPADDPFSDSPSGPVVDPGSDPADVLLYSDIPRSHRYSVAIEDLTDCGVVNGAPGGLFRPGDPVTRQQFAKMIVLGGDYAVSESDICPFRDVQKGGDATLYPDNYVAVCAAKGIAQGKTASKFEPYANITRAQVMTMVIRAAKDLKPSAVPAPPAGWKGVLPAKDPTHGANIARAEYNGLLAGIDLSLFSVNGKATRGEVAQIIWNFRAK